MQSQIIGKIRILSGEKNTGRNYFAKSFEDRSNEIKYLFTTVFIKKTRLLVSGRSPECSDCFLRFIEQQ